MSKLIFGFIGCLVLFLFAHTSNNQSLPPLEKLTPITKQISATKENFVAARGSWYWIDMRLTSIPVMFTINRGNYIGSNTETYQNIRRSIRVGDEVTVWGIPKAPSVSETVFFSKVNRKPLHELDVVSSENTDGALDSFHEDVAVNYDDEVLEYIVVQMTRNGQTLLNYETFAKEFNQAKNQMFWIWIITGLVTFFLGLGIIIIFISKPSKQKR